MASIDRDSRLLRTKFEATYLQKASLHAEQSEHGGLDPLTLVS